jgi:hypothetical protein
MSAPVRVPRLMVVALVLGGCVYYNGMYNANRLASSARKAERDGRTFEASNLWGQVATKAESVVARHPTSKYAEEAGILRGVALAKLGQCEQALDGLSAATLHNISGDLAEDALLATGRCQLSLGNIAASEAAFGELLNSKDPERRREARFQQARLLRQSGRYAEALDALKGIRDPRADGERMLALAGVGRTDRAMALVDSLVIKRDTARLWDSLLVIMGRQNPAAASQLLDHIRTLPARSSELQARRFLEDGMRLAYSDTARAAKRFHEAISVGGQSDAAGRASLQLVLMDLRAARQVADLPPAMLSLEQLSDRYESVAYQATQLGATVSGIHTAATSMTWETPRGDLRLFLAAEAARDSLEAPYLARSLFRRVLEDYPNSSYAAKVVLALEQLDSTWADSAKGLLEGRYVDSPYLAMIRGQDSDEYRRLEDSLGAYAASLVVKPPTAGSRRALPRRADDAEEPHRRPPAPGASRVPEP